ncbi:MAG TPA: LysM peptidoglycan-binding domain-containing protein [Polyangiaceae bacterium]|nr:LysM peptidoglycan-binding domain-containing protein [Polyangiaceae bacterium]
MRFLSRFVSAAVLLFALPAQAETHVVASGQTLGRIADRYNVTIAALCEANGLQRRAPLKVGFKLRIPEGTDAVVGEESATDPAESASARARNDGDSKANDAVDKSDTLLSGGMHVVTPKGAAPAYYFEPTGPGRQSMRPILVYLHARGGHPERDCRRWAPVARRLGWLVCPTGPAAYGDGRAWDNNWPSAHTATMSAIQVLRKKYGRRVQLYGNTLIGFSEGAYAAMNVGVREPHVFNRWLILAATDQYWGGPGMEALQTAKERVRRVFLITGEHDGVIDGTHQVEAWLSRAGVDTRVVTPGDMGHELALDRKPELYQQALAWLDRGDAKGKKNRHKNKSKDEHADRVARQ